MGQLRRRGRIWWVRYYRNGRRFEESSRSTKYEDARTLLKDREGDIAKGLPVSPRLHRLKFSDAAKDIEAEYTVNKRKTEKHLKRRLKLHLTPFFGHRRMAEITTADIRAFSEARLKAGASAAEINRELAVLKRMYSLAMKAGQLLARPHIPMLREDNVRRGFFDRAQFEQVKAALPEPLRPVVTFAYLTGWRLTSEILPLEWRQVDWESRVVALDPGTTKNREGREFPFTQELEQLLKSQLSEFERLKKAGRIVPQVFHRNGKPIRNLRGAWATACEAACYPGRLLHDFRRTAVRNLEKAGVSRSAAMAMVGHKTEAIYRRYAIVDAGALRDAAAKIDRAAVGTNAGTTGRRVKKSAKKQTA